MVKGVYPNRLLSYDVTGAAAVRRTDQGSRELPQGHAARWPRPPPDLAGAADAEDAAGIR
jgi:hypothetical protein